MFVNFLQVGQRHLSLFEEWTQDINKYMGITAIAGNIANFNARVATFIRNTVVELIGRPHLVVVQQERLIFFKISFHMKLMPSWNNFACKLAASGQGT